MRDVELRVHERDQRAGARDRRGREPRVDDAVAPGRRRRERVGRGTLRARRVAVGLGVAQQARTAELGGERSRAGALHAPGAARDVARIVRAGDPCGARARPGADDPSRRVRVDGGGAHVAGQRHAGRVRAPQAGGGDGGERARGDGGRGQDEGAGRHDHHGRRSAAASDSREIRFRAGGSQQRRRGPVALLAVLLPQALQRREHGARADQVAPRERPPRVVEAQLHAPIDVRGRADALAEREARLVDELGDDPPADEPRPVADPFRAAAERREERLGRGGDRRGGDRPAGELDEPGVAHGQGQGEAGRAPARILGGERSGVAEEHLRAALQRRVVLAGAAVHDQRRHLAVRLPGRPRVPARGVRRGEQVMRRPRPRPRRPRGARRRRPARARADRRAGPAGRRTSPGPSCARGARSQRAARRAATAASGARASGHGRTPRSPRRRRRRPGPSARRGPSGSRRRGGRCGRPARAWRAPPARSAAPRARTAGCSG